MKLPSIQLVAWFSWTAEYDKTKYGIAIYRLLEWFFGVPLNVCQVVLAALSKTELLFIESGVKSSGQCYRDILLFQQTMLSNMSWTTISYFFQLANEPNPNTRATSCCITKFYTSFFLSYGSRQPRAPKAPISIRFHYHCCELQGNKIEEIWQHL